jgi:hypothetical protein
MLKCTLERFLCYVTSYDNIQLVTNDKGEPCLQVFKEANPLKPQDTYLQLNLKTGKRKSLAKE